MLKGATEFETQILQKGSCPHLQVRIALVLLIRKIQNFKFMWDVQLFDGPEIENSVLGIFSLNIKDSVIGTPVPSLVYF